jgi:hypothetical protein
MYGKLFSSMFRGSLYGKWQAIVTFQQMIILADQEGTVDFTPEALSATTSIPLDILQEGIRLLELPDPATRTPDEEGRRIVRLSEDRPWGWRIVNYLHYRAIRTAEDRRAYHREYWHNKRKLTQPASTTTQQTQPIAEAKAEAYAKAGTTSASSEKISLSAIGQWLNIPVAMMQKWGEAYPAVNIDAQLAKAAVWVMANPKNKKSNYARFLSNWFSREQDRAPRTNGGQHEADRKPDNSAPARVKRAHEQRRQDRAKQVN